jgi:hypothetical protein
MLPVKAILNIPSSSSPPALLPLLPPLLLVSSSEENDDITNALTYRTLANELVFLSPTLSIEEVVVDTYNQSL